jgi:uncharacterized damage-inducible protein DinB
MKQLLHQLSLYNIWANKLLVEKLNELAEEQLNKEVASSFSSLYQTVLHMMDVESVWWQRIQLAERVEWPAKLLPEVLMNFQKNFYNHRGNGRSG